MDSYNVIILREGVMAKKKLAFDIGESYIKIAVKDGTDIQIHTIQMPQNLMKDGMVQMPHMLTDFLKEVKKEHGLKKGECGLVLPDEVTVCRSITLPAMTEKQLEVNLPFEFSDYISSDPQKYVYDYALQEMKCDENGKPEEMVIKGAVVSKEVVSSYIQIFKDAGLKLRTLIPQEIALGNIMEMALAEHKIEAEKEYCIVNLGHCSTEVYIFKGNKQVVLRNISIGNCAIDRVISENEHVDEYVARTYKNNNYHDVLEQDYCREAFGRVAVEIMKVINFYRFSNRDTTLDEIYFMGGGSNIKALCETIAETNDMQCRYVSDLVPVNIDKDANLAGVLALGVLLQ